MNPYWTEWHALVVGVAACWTLVLGIPCQYGAGDTTLANAAVGATMLSVLAVVVWLNERGGHRQWE